MIGKWEIVIGGIGDASDHYHCVCVRMGGWDEIPQMSTFEYLGIPKVRNLGCGGDDDSWICYLYGLRVLENQGRCLKCGFLACP